MPHFDRRYLFDEGLNLTNFVATKSSELFSLEVFSLFCFSSESSLQFGLYLVKALSSGVPTPPLLELLPFSSTLPTFTASTPLNLTFLLSNLDNLMARQFVICAWLILLIPCCASRTAMDCFNFGCLTFLRKKPNLGFFCNHLLLVLENQEHLI